MLTGQRSALPPLWSPYRKDTRPVLLFTLTTDPRSIGSAAIFLLGGPTRDAEPTPILLRSGDVVIMSGPECRRAYHGQCLCLTLSHPKLKIKNPKASQGSWKVQLHCI